MQSKLIAPGAKALRPKDVAAALGVDRSTVYREVEAGRLVSYRVGTGRGTIRITHESFRAYLAERGIPAGVLEVAL